MTDLDSATRNSYDVVPYESLPFAQSHPNRLATIATLLGLTPTPLEHCRVLELGCASGGNLLPMAEMFPGSQFVGVDASGGQIADGQRTLDAVGAPNLHLLHRNILDVDDQLGSFDYILTHGVYSWVPPAVQEKILEICARQLTPQGVAYVSYNTYPGWRMRGLVRDLMCYRARGFASPEDKIREALALLEFLAQSVPPEQDAYGLVLKDELKRLRSNNASYVLHEYLEDENRPAYFHEFMEQAQRQGLQYLGEADFNSMSIGNFPPPVEAGLRQLAADIVQLEQVMDFVRNRRFRQTLLCHQQVVLDRSLPAERVFGLYVASASEPQGGPIDVGTRDSVTFRAPASTLTTDEPWLKAALVQLRQVWPGRVAFRELLKAAQRRLDPQGSETPCSAREERALGAALLRCYAARHVDLSVQPTPCALQVPERPRAPRLARQQVSTGSDVTNLWHAAVTVSGLARHLLRYLDGNSDRAALTELLYQDGRRGQLVVHDQDHPVPDDQGIRQILDEALEESLGELARLGLLL